MGEGKNTGDESPARGWDLFKWKPIGEPPVGVTAAVYVTIAIFWLVVAGFGIAGLVRLLAAIGTSPSLVTASPESDKGAELRGGLLVIGALLTTPFVVWRLIVAHWSAQAARRRHEREHV